MYTSPLWTLAPENSGPLAAACCAGSGIVTMPAGAASALRDAPKTPVAKAAVAAARDLKIERREESLDVLVTAVSFDGTGRSAARITAPPRGGQARAGRLRRHAFSIPAATPRRRISDLHWPRPCLPTASPPCLHAAVFRRRST